MVARQAGLQRTLPRTRIGIFLGMFYSAHNGPIPWRLRRTVNGLEPVKKCCAPTPPTRTLRRLDMEAEEVINTAFGTNLSRLRAIKQKYDPTNFFRVNYNIKPSAQAGSA